jgi:putative membrane protein
MHSGKYYRLGQALDWTKKQLIIFTFIAFIPTFLYEIAGFKWLTIPWLPVALIGTALAFVIGFKNNASYDRLWEARKIWGAIVNSSRTWGIMVLDFISNLSAKEPINKAVLNDIHKRLIYRHLAWLTALRYQLRQPREWEQIDDKHVTSYLNDYSYPEIRINVENELKEYLSDHEILKILDKKNRATKIISLQSKDLKDIYEKGYIDTFKHITLEKMLGNFYDQQGQCERIKTFPYPRQYATFSRLAIWLFILLVPFGMLEEFEEMGDFFIWVTIPFSILVSWVFYTIERIGGATENPFEGGINDIPLTAICRTIEIDLRDMLDEEEIPEPIKPIKDILM